MKIKNESNDIFEWNHSQNYDSRQFKKLLITDLSTFLSSKYLPKKLVAMMKSKYEKNYDGLMFLKTKHSRKKFPNSSLAMNARSHNRTYLTSSTTHSFLMERRGVRRVRYVIGHSPSLNEKIREGRALFILI